MMKSSILTCKHGLSFSNFYQIELDRQTFYLPTFWGPCSLVFPNLPMPKLFFLVFFLCFDFHIYDHYSLWNTPKFLFMFIEVMLSFYETKYQPTLWGPCFERG